MTHLIRAIPRLFLPILILALAACSPDAREATLKKCVATAEQETPQQSGQSVEERHDAVGEGVADCMKDAGYRHDMASAECLDDVDFNKACYVPRRH